MLFAYILIFILALWLISFSSQLKNLTLENSILKRKLTSLLNKVNSLDAEITKLYKELKYENVKQDKPADDNSKEVLFEENKTREEIIAKEEINKEAEVDEEELDSENYAEQQESANIEVREYSEDIHINENCKIKNKFEDSKNTFESVFMGNLFNKIGAVAILIAVCIFVKLISSYIVFTDAMKITAGFIVGIGMIFGAFKLRKDEKLKTYSEVLMGTGFGTILITIYCATSLMNMFSVPIATILASLVVIATYLIANKQKTVSMLIIGLIGGYLNPFFVNNSADINFIFYSLIFLNLITLCFSYKNKDKEWVNVVNLVATAVTILLYSLFNTKEISLAPILILWSIYIIYDILYILSFKQGTTISKTQGYINLSVLTLLSYILFKENFMAIGMILVYASIVYFIIGIYRYRKNDIENNFLYSGVIAIFFATFFMSEKFLRIILWSIESSFILYLATYYKQKNIAKLSHLFLFTSLASLFINKVTYNTDFNLIFNERTLYFAPVTISLFVNSFIYKFNRDKKLEKFSKFLGLSLIYIFALCEITSLIKAQNYECLFINFISYAILGFIYSINVSYFADSKNSFYYKASDVILYISLAILLIADLSYSNFNKISFIPILNIRALAYPMAFLGLYSKLKNQQSDTLKYLCVIVGFIYAHLESVNIANNFTAIDISWFISLIWILYAGIISITGILNKKAFLKNSGIWISIFSIIRIFCYDLAEVDMIFKLLAFITLGIVLMAVSYIYNKKAE